MEAKETKSIKIPQIINRPQLVPNSKKSFFAFLALLGWLSWFYFFSPLLTLLLWLFGYKRFNDYIIYEWQTTLNNLKEYEKFFLLAASIFISWALYNWLRFKNKKRRKGYGQVSTADIANFFQLEEQEIKNLQHSNRIILYFDNKGKIIKTGCTKQSD